MVPIKSVTMNAFQILNKEDQAISINELDQEVCELVGVSQDKKYYCRLGKREEFKSELDYLWKTSNWYDTIGWMIASEGKSFQDILDYYTDTMKEFIGQKDENDTVITLEYIYPYHTKLLTNWINKGYIAKQVIV
jgi:hypothetical protein